MILSRRKPVDVVPVSTMSSAIVDSSGNRVCDIVPGSFQYKIGDGPWCKDGNASFVIEGDHSRAMALGFHPGDELTFIHKAEGEDLDALGEMVEAKRGLKDGL